MQTPLLQTPLLQMSGICKSFGGVEVLHSVDFNATGGETVALLGENGAGKSTLVKILSGDYSPDSGVIDLAGNKFEGLTPIDSRNLGVRMIYQEFQDAGALTVAENICLGRWPTKNGLVDWREMSRVASDVLTQMGVDIDPHRPLETLGVGERQIVEIARALADDARILVLDEPTAALSQQEVERLFDWVRRLRSAGVAIIYITHRLDEVYELSDRVVVLRNGYLEKEGVTTDVSRRELVEHMVGRDIGEVGRPTDGPADEAGLVALRMDGVSLGKQVDDVSLELRFGEVLCLYGKLGSGTAQVAEMCFGLAPMEGGTMSLQGLDYAPSSPTEAIAKGVGYVPPDRKREGVFLVRPVAENLAIASWRRIGFAGILVTAQRQLAAFNRWREKLNISSVKPEVQSIGNLSGGNQQKVVLGRWLERESNVLVLVEPTRGVDVGARQEIYSNIRSLAKSGKAVLMVTSDYEEAVQVSDRTLVMTRGQITSEFLGEEVTTQSLIEASGG